MALDALPGGDQSVLEALPAPLQACLSRAPRVVLIANNPAITAADFQALNIGVDDVVVSFNTCIKASLLDSRSVNVVVHGYNAQDAYFLACPWGRTCSGCLIRRVSAVSPCWSAVPHR